jgi:translocator protein
MRTPMISNNALTLAGWLALCFLASAGAVFVSVDGWYETLRKPAWNPPAWLFAPAWTTLYIMMGVAAWLVWLEGGWAAQRLPLSLFLLQWALNALWTPLFFAMHLPGLAFVEILFLWLAIAATLVTFWHVRPLAGLLLVPYLGWVTFAAILNFTIWQMNR